MTGLLGRSHRFVGRRALALGGFLMAGVLAAAAVALALPSGGWQRQGSGSAEFLTGVEFVNAQQGWAVGSAGTMLSTKDGGMSWERQDAGTDAWLTDVSFADTEHGWIVTDDGAVLATADGGQRWKAQTVAPGVSLSTLTAVDATHVWATGCVGGELVVALTKDGSTWESHASTSYGSPLLDAAFVGMERGWAVGFAGNILVTGDGGRTWQKQESGTDADLLSVCFTDDRHGWAAGYSGGGLWGTRAMLLTTSDGGTTWQVRHAGSRGSLFRDVRFLDADRGWAVGDVDCIRDAVMATTDGGATWRIQAVAPHQLERLDIADAGHGWAVGWSGEIVATANGGASSDHTPPVTSVRGAGGGWRQSWALRFTAGDDEGGSGVAVVQHSTDRPGRWQDGTSLRLTSGEDHRYDGIHTVCYRAVDAAGNVASTRSVKVRIDSRPPVTRIAEDLTVRHGDAVHIGYLVHDRSPCAGWAKVRVTIFTPTTCGASDVVKVVDLGRVSVDVWHTLRCRCDLPRGSYVMMVRAVDGAGNVGFGRTAALTVR